MVTYAHDRLTMNTAREMLAATPAVLPFILPVPLARVPEGAPVIEADLATGVALVPVMKTALQALGHIIQMVDDARYPRLQEFLVRQYASMRLPSYAEAVHISAAPYNTVPIARQAVEKLAPHAAARDVRGMSYALHKAFAHAAELGTPTKERAVALVHPKHGGIVGITDSAMRAASATGCAVVFADLQTMHGAFMQYPAPRSSAVLPLYAPALMLQLVTAWGLLENDMHDDTEKEIANAT